MASKKSSSNASEPPSSRHHAAGPPSPDPKTASPAKDDPLIRRNGNGHHHNGGSAPDVEIRELEFDDLAQVFALGERLFTADRYPALYRTWEEYELVEFFLTDGDTSFVAEFDNRIVGFALGTVIQKRRSAWTYGYLMWLGVDPDYSRQGIATRLVRRLKEVFIEEGARMIMVDTAADNSKALAFFEEMGFGSLQEHVYLSLNLTGDRTYKRLRRQGRSNHALVTQRMSLSTPPAPDPRPVPPPVLSESPREN